MNRRSRKRKSGFLTFCFSFLPGAGEMYLGFMRMGVSLMGLFFALIALAALLNIPAILFVLVVVWFYSFFHVHNLAGLPDDEFLNMEDEFLFNLDVFFRMDDKNVEKYRKAAAVILVAIGVLLLWDGIKDLFFAYLPDEIWRFIVRIENRILKILVGVVIIAGGVRMIKGKEEELKEVTIDVDSRVSAADEGMAGGYGAGSGSFYGSGFGGSMAYGERSGNAREGGSSNVGMPDADGWNMGMPGTGSPNAGVSDGDVRNMGMPGVGSPNASVSDGDVRNMSMPGTGSPNAGVSDGDVRNMSMPGTGSPNAGVSDGDVRNMSMPNAGSPNVSISDAGGQNGSKAGCEGMDGGYVRGMAADVIYGVDTRTGGMPERSNYGEGQER